MFQSVLILSFNPLSLVIHYLSPMFVVRTPSSVPSARSLVRSPLSISTSFFSFSFSLWQVHYQSHDTHVFDRIIFKEGQWIEQENKVSITPFHTRSLLLQIYFSFSFLASLLPLAIRRTHFNLDCNSICHWFLPIKDSVSKPMQDFNLLFRVVRFK